MWPFTRPPREVSTAEVLQRVLDMQQETQAAVLRAVQTMAEASGKQAQVLQAYLELFKTPGEPERWEHDPQAQNMDELLRAGFPKDATEAEQAEWVLKHL